MHKLNRSLNAPLCLSNYDYLTYKWPDLASSCKRELRAALVLMQSNPNVTMHDANEYGLRCAYCEGSIFHEGHIEHFRRKNPAHFPQLTFAWSNLFLACGSTTHCGHYKDRSSAAHYDPDDLIKPDEDDASDFLYFHSHGNVRVRSGLDPQHQQRAEETIRVFGLNDPALSGRRAKAVSVYKQRLMSDLSEIESWSEEDRNDYLLVEIEATRWDPYSTTIHHFLTAFN